MLLTLILLILLPLLFFLGLVHPFIDVFQVFVIQFIFNHLLLSIDFHMVLSIAVLLITGSFSSTLLPFFIKFVKFCLFLVFLLLLEFGILLL